MTNSNTKKNMKWEILQHKALPGYKTAFHIIIIIAVIYFIYVFAAS